MDGNIIHKNYIQGDTLVNLFFVGATSRNDQLSLAGC